MKRSDFINLISFCILMENNDGIVGKAPMYVLEKWETKNPLLLDSFNMKKLTDYIEKWEISIPKAEE